MIRLETIVERLERGSERETERTRERLHMLESDRHMVVLLAKQLSELSDNIKEIARAAAGEMLVLALEHRDELGRGRWSSRSQWVAVGVAFSALLLGVLK